MKASYRYLSAVLLMAGMTLASPSHADVTRIEQNHPSVSYEGSWQTVNGSAVSSGSVAASNSANASVTVSFTGTGIAWIGYRSRQAGGFARVYLDGALHTTVGTHATSPQPQSDIFRIGGLPNNTHTLRIEVTGDMQGGDPAGGDAAYIAIDAFDVDDGQADQLIQESDFSVTYTGAWTEIDDPSVSGGSVRVSRGVNASVYVNFYGTGIEWIGYRCPCTAGIAQINLLESGFLAYKHTYTPDRQAQAAIYRIEGLPLGQHRLEIYVTGNTIAADPANAWVVVDAFRILNGSTGGNALESTPPTVSMTAPANNALVTGDVTLAANAADASGIVKVNFYAGDLYLGEDSTAPYAITRNTANIPSGSHYTLHARAYDTAGNYARSSNVDVTVQHTDRTRPGITITAPAANSTVAGTINVSANATDDFGIESVTFYRDRCCWNQLGPSDTATPYVTSLNTASMLDGPHTLLARARDTSGNVTDAEPVTITVDNSVQPGMVRVDDDDSGITFTGAWTLQGGADGYGTPLFHWGSAAVSETIGATATFTFNGTGVRWISYACAFFCGDATVSIDGGPAQAVSMRGNDDFGEPENLARVVYTSPVLASGTHTVTITVTNAHPSGQGRIYVDAFEILTN